MVPTPRTRTWAGPTLVVMGGALWGTTGTAAAFAPAGSGAASIGAARIVVGGVLLALLAAQPIRACWRTWRSGTLVQLAVGAVAVAAYQVFFFSSVERTGVAIGTVVALGSAPLLTGLLARALGSDRLSGRWVIATLAAIAGCTVLVLGDGGTAPTDRWGIALALGAGLSYACYAIMASRLIVGGMPDRAVIGAMFGGAAVLLLPVLLATDPTWLTEPRGILVTAHLAVLATVASYLLYGRGLRTTPVSIASTLTLSEPAVAALLGVLVLGEAFTSVTATGITLVALALVILLVPAHRATLPGRRRTARWD